MSYVNARHRAGAGRAPRIRADSINSVWRIGSLADPTWRPSLAIGESGRRTPIRLVSTAAVRSLAVHPAGALGTLPAALGRPQPPEPGCGRGRATAAATVGEVEF